MPLAKAMIEAAGNSTQPTYIEDIFSTYLYTGNGSTQTITNGIDLAGKGGMVWMKDRSAAANHYLCPDSSTTLYSNTTAAAGGNNATFLSTGFTDTRGSASGNLQVSWTFRKQPKFFDVVTYTGGGSTPVTVSHSLGSTPGFIVTKRIDSTSDWTSWHRSSTYMLQLNRTDAASSTINNFAGFINNVGPTTFQVNAGSSANDINVSGGAYVAYLFAHNAGGFGLTGTDNVISCGSFVGTGAEQEINLGYEPQFVIRKAASTTSGWAMFDNMRGFSQTNTAYLNANLSNAESNYTGSDNDKPTATGFRTTVGSGQTWIYIAIRRGPMKTPTSGTSVFSPVATSVSTGTKVTTGFPVDLQLAAYRDFEVNKYALDRLRGVSTTEFETSQTRRLLTNTTGAEATGSDTRYWDNTGFQNSSVFASNNVVFWNFRRAPGFFDEVCYTGTGSARTVAHNLGVAPELMITKKRSEATNSSFWWVYHKDFVQPYYALLNSNAAGTATGTALYLSVGATTYTAQQEISQSSQTYVAYLFASCPGVSKVGSYTGNGSTQTINCGFTGGARFVLIKRTDSTGDWYVYDTARGMTTLTDPYLLLNSTAAESATLGSVTTVSTGFAVNASILAAINTNGASYIYLAIA